MSRDDFCPFYFEESEQEGGQETWETHAGENGLGTAQLRDRGGQLSIC